MTTESIRVTANEMSILTSSKFDCAVQELYDKFVKAIKGAAESGCRTVTVSYLSQQRGVYNYNIKDEVIKMLREDGFRTEIDRVFDKVKVQWL